MNILWKEGNRLYIQNMCNKKIQDWISDDITTFNVYLASESFFSSLIKGHIIWIMNYIATALIEEYRDHFCYFVITAHCIHTHESLFLTIIHSNLVYFHEILYEPCILSTLSQVVLLSYINNVFFVKELWAGVSSTSQNESLTFFDKPHITIGQRRWRTDSKMPFTKITSKYIGYFTQCMYIWCKTCYLNALYNRSLTTSLQVAVVPQGLTWKYNIFLGKSWLHYGLYDSPCRSFLQDHQFTIVSNITSVSKTNTV